MAVLFTPLSEAVIVMFVVEVTVKVVTVKVFEVVPEVTVTLAGTVATAVFELVRVTTSPAAGAFPSKVTVPVEDVPPKTLVLLRVTDKRLVGVTVSVAVCVPPYVPLIVTGVEDETTKVVTVKVFVVVPAATVTLAGTVATAVLELERVTTAPPVGAAPLRVTVPVDELPPTTVVGERVTV